MLVIFQFLWSSSKYLPQLNPLHLNTEFLSLHNNLISSELFAYGIRLSEGPCKNGLCGGSMGTLLDVVKLS